jgi:hypothetical protein
MLTLLKDFFNSMMILKISQYVLVIKIFQISSVKGTLRYRKRNFFTTSALFQLQFLGYPAYKGAAQVLLLHTCLPLIAFSGLTGI